MNFFYSVGRLVALVSVELGRPIASLVVTKPTELTPYITKAISKNGRYVAQITSLIEDIPQVYSLPEKITQEDADAIMEGVYDALKDIGRISIGEQIQEHRKEQGLSQKDLADMVGFTHTNISRIEQGKYNVSLDILNRISYALGREIRLE